jgi:3-keto-disaccharide hydrolase
MRFLLIGTLLSGLTLVSAPSFAADDFKPEPGFTMLFNGKNFDGWKLRSKKDGADLDGKTEVSGGRLKVVDGSIVIDYKMKGDTYIDTKAEFSKDLTIKFEFKPGDGCNNDLLIRGTKFDIVTSAKKETKGIKMDQWNEMEITFKGDTATYKVGGESVGTRKITAEKGAFSIRAEFGPIEIRKLRIKEEK